MASLTKSNKASIVGVTLIKSKANRVALMI